MHADPPPAVELTITPSGSPLGVLGGSDVTLHCSVAEETAVDTLQWLRNGTELSNRVTRESNGLALSLDNITVCFYISTLYTLYVLLQTQECSYC